MAPDGMPSRLKRSVQYTALFDSSAVDLGVQRAAILKACAGGTEAIVIRKLGGTESFSNPHLLRSEATILDNLREQTRKVLATLTPREEQILRRRFRKRTAWSTSTPFSSVPIAINRLAIGFRSLSIHA
jgi:hypothetical protein